MAPQPTPISTTYGINNERFLRYTSKRRNTLVRELKSQRDASVACIVPRETAFRTGNPRLPHPVVQVASHRPSSQTEKCPRGF